MPIATTDNLTIPRLADSDLIGIPKSAHSLFQDLAKDYSLGAKKIQFIYSISRDLNNEFCSKEALSIAGHVAEGASHGDLLRITESFPGAFRSLDYAFGRDLIETERHFSTSLQRIYQSTSEQKRDRAFYELDRELFHSDPHTVAELYERYGHAGYAIIYMLGDAVFEKEALYRHVLETISNASHQDPLAFRALNIDHLEAFPDHIEKIARAAGKNCAATLYALEEVKFLDHPDRVVEVVELYGEHADTALVVCSKFGIEFEILARKNLQQLIKAIKDVGQEQWTRYAISKLSLHHFVSHTEDLTQLIHLTCDPTESKHGEKLSQLFALLTDKPEILQHANKCLFALAHRRGSGLLSQIQHIPQELMVKDPELLYELTLAAGYEVSNVFQHINVPLALSHGHEVVGVVQRHGPAAGGLFKSCGADLLQIEKDQRYDIETIVDTLQESAGAFFEHTPPHKWKSDASLQYQERFGIATGWITANKETKRIVNKSNFCGLVDLNTSQFNLFNIQRILPSQEKKGQWLLEENQRNLDPEYKPERSIIVYGVADYDLGVALQDGSTDFLYRLGQDCRLMLCGLRQKHDLPVQVLRAASLFGHNEHGDPIKLLHGAFVYAHSGPEHSTLSRSTVPLLRENEDGRREFFPYDGELQVSDHELFYEVGSMIEPGGHFGIMGCAPGKRVNGSDSFIDIIARSMRHLHVTGATESTYSSPNRNSHQILLDDSGRIKKIAVHSGSEQIRTIPPRDLNFLAEVKDPYDLFSSAHAAQAL